MNYTGKIVVKNGEGIREEHDWGAINKLPRLSWRKPMRISRTS